MNSASAINELFAIPQVGMRFIAVAVLICIFSLVFFAQTSIIKNENGEETLIVDDAADSEILAFGKNVVVKSRAKGVFAFGGNVVIEGAVEADVATIGGSILQKRGASIGGDVIALGGAYTAEDEKPLRSDGRETVVIGVFEEEFRSFAQNPTAMLAPALTWSFFAQRVLSVLFWFVITFGVTTISPGGISRAVARFQLSGTRIIALGMAGLIGTSVAIIVSVGLIPGYLGGILGLMMLFLLFFAYVFGRVALQVSLGKLIQKHLLPENNQSETVAILLGVVGWTVILSIPFVWTIALFILFAASIGLVLTARTGNGWQRS